MIFFDDSEAFALITVLQMGKNYQHNRDGFVYFYSPQRQYRWDDESAGHGAGSHRPDP